MHVNVVISFEQFAALARIKIETLDLHDVYLLDN
jgi:hypothetical protein